MVKVKTICRAREAYGQDTTQDLPKMSKNTDSNLHPFAKAREYTRAVNAAKLERIFAKPFVSALDGHTDSVMSLSRSDKHLSLFVSGSSNGELKLWDLSVYKQVWGQDDAHTGFVTSLSFKHDHILSAGKDASVKLWDLSSNRPKTQFNTNMPVSAVDFNWEVPTLFACSGTEGFQLWDVNRSQALFSTSWHPETLLTCKFNPAETPLVATTGGDNSIVLYDTRSYSALHRTVLKRRCNAVAWNPREPMHFIAGCDDSNVYSFDMRKMEEIGHIFKDHLNAVMALSYNPTGREFASGGFDRTVRIFDIKDQRSREVYHTRRMQQVSAVEFSGDGKFVISGSDDTNLRVWKAKSHVPLKTLLPREADAMQYREKLKQKYQYHSEVRRLLKHRHLPRNLFKERKKQQIMTESEMRKERNRRDHTKPENIVTVSERKAKVIQIEQ
mmetsp:Transcript_19126/g.34821  ORF Transcript_19126/g.34821 Transcript_19126/m.34821 type:complete len:442 (+) Transcript_19126:1477-2802(+)|eukprot:CAMPEP_0204901020 /NCGR_PEP_ID=MMETSP1397-20131031/2822_1 /ASSEMBLY_ACC=CAM_ASM_000891 /TAXON_ID=49980 /ORGANISM="Climacostomum Climacostomum virens, Strain Stock W-24" /LENGTH=441 /DNA_ID=CAMNT_0052069281 /DNA_START=759 /DNA_END=2084 /DNA_ORIENTATION=+